MISNPVERKEGENKEEGVGPLGAHFPRGDLRWETLGVPVIRATVKPMAVVVDVELLEVSELVERVMLQVVSLYNN